MNIRWGKLNVLYANWWWGYFFKKVMRIAKNDKQMSSHMPTLLLALQKTKGAVCELGAGFYSTPFLHWMCPKRMLYSYENNAEYLHYASRFHNNYHRTRHLNDIDYERNWSVVFIDHAPGSERGAEALKFKNAEVIVLHDTESEQEYGYDKIWSHFKYRLDSPFRPQTTIISNKIDVTKWQ